MLRWMQVSNRTRTRKRVGEERGQEGGQATEGGSICWLGMAPVPADDVLVEISFIRRSGARMLSHLDWRCEVYVVLSRAWEREPVCVPLVRGGHCHTQIYRNTGSPQ